jgi:hypothetical protein
VNYFTLSNGELAKFLLQILPSYWGDPTRASTFPSVVSGCSRKLHAPPFELS